MISNVVRFASSAYKVGKGGGKNLERLKDINLPLYRAIKARPNRTKIVNAIADFFQVSEHLVETTTNCTHGEDIYSFKTENPLKHRAFTYFIYDHTTKLTKIGRTDNVLERFKQHQRNNATNELELMYVINGDAEVSMHRYFKEKEVSNELFDIDLNQLKMFIEIISSNLGAVYHE